MLILFHKEKYKHRSKKEIKDLKWIKLGDSRGLSLTVEYLLSLHLLGYQGVLAHTSLPSLFRSSPTGSHTGSLRLRTLSEYNLQALSMPWKHLSERSLSLETFSNVWEWPQATWRNYEVGHCSKPTVEQEPPRVSSKAAFPMVCVRRSANLTNVCQHLHQSMPQSAMDVPPHQHM